MCAFSLFKKPEKEDIFEIFPDGVLIVSSDGKILDLNSKALSILDFPKLELVGSYFSKYVQGGSALLNRLVQSGTSAVAKVDIPKNEDIYVEVTASRTEESDKVYVAIRDVTKNYKMQNMINGEYEIAKKIIDEKNIFLKTISDEVFSLINSASSFSKALKDGLGGPLNDKQDKYVAIIDKSTDDLLYILTKLFKYFEVESMLYTPESKNFDLADLMTSIAKTYEQLFEKKKLNFSYDMSSFDVRSASTDATAISMFIKALLDVSLKSTDIGSVSMNIGNPPLEFMQSKGYDNADDAMRKRYAMFEIKDSGLVFPANVLDNIFNPYWVDETVSRKLLITKIVYAYVYKHVKNLKGDMWVYSNATQGTLVCILLPMTEKK